MGGLPWDVAARDLPVPEAISQRRAALGIPQATPRAQEAPPQAAKRGQGQACGDGQTAPDTQDQSTKRSKSVYNIISTQGWLEGGELESPIGLELPLGRPAVTLRLELDDTLGHGLPLVGDLPLDRDQRGKSATAGPTTPARTDKEGSQCDQLGKACPHESTPGLPDGGCRWWWTRGLRMVPSRHALPTSDGSHPI